ncbi:24334_t:CDS:1, partial [Gigaspora rosea]
AWEAIDINMIRKSFKCCGISNTMDGTKDDLILDFKRLMAQINSGKGIEEQNDDKNN